MKTRKSLLLFLCVLCMCLFFIGCEGSTPRRELSVAEMERMYLANREEFKAVQEQIVALFEDQSDLSKGAGLRISRPDTETKNTDGASEAALILSTELLIPEAERLALLQAAEPLFEQSPLLCIFANDHEVYFYYYEKWGYEHYVAYRADGVIPRGSFGNFEADQQIDTNWYAVISHD